jgi:hypothetical protein
MLLDLRLVQTPIDQTHRLGQMLRLKMMQASKVVQTLIVQSLLQALVLSSTRKLAWLWMSSQRQKLPAV